MEVLESEQRPVSAFSPFKSRVFLAVWLAAMTSNIGSLIQSVGEKWQMTQLTPSMFLVALVETGTTLPVLLLGMAAGAIADIVDRRKWMIATQVFMMAVAGVLALLTFLHLISPAVLLTMAILIGIGSSLSMPVIQAIMPELLPKRELSAGVALNSAGYNVSRAIGPALGGLIVGWFGAGWAFLLNAISFLAVVMVFWKWKRPVPTQALPSERFLGAMKVGFRYSRHSWPLQVILLRTAGYVWFSCVIFSLLPSLAIHHLKMGSTGFGVLAGCIGLGAVAITLALPALRTRFSASQLLNGFAILAALSQMAIALVPRTHVVVFCLFISGTTWLATFSTVNTAIQISVPSWVKARAFGVYQMAWGGAMALASAFWGAVAERYGIQVGFALAALGMLLSLLFIGKMRIAAFEEELDLSPHSGKPHSTTCIPLDAGPVLIQVDFRVLLRDREPFLEGMQEVRRLRLRDGAIRWALFEEPDRSEADCVRFLETYLHSSMGEHLRQHGRNTNADREILDKVFRLDIAGRPHFRHLTTVGDTEPSLLQRFLGIN